MSLTDSTTAIKDVSRVGLDGEKSIFDIQAGEKDLMALAAHLRDKMNEMGIQSLNISEDAINFIPRSDEKSRASDAKSFMIEQRRKLNGSGDRKPVLIDVESYDDECPSNPMLDKSSIYYEPLIDPDLADSDFYPISNPPAWEMYKKLEAAPWTAGKINYTDDKKQWPTLPQEVREATKKVISFFSNSEQIVMENVSVNFAEIFTDRCVRMFYRLQAQNEQVHEETYNDQVDVLADDEEDKKRMRSASKNDPTIKKKADWAKKWLKTDRPIAERVIAFILVEGIHFSSSFAFILWLKLKGWLPGICEANDYIMNDEGMHREFGELMKNIMNQANAPSQEIVNEMFTEAVDLECEFACSALPTDLLGFNSNMVCEYVKSLADSILIKIGYSPIYNISSPITWMEMNNLDGKANFFEKSSTEYKRAEATLNVRPTDFDKITLPTWTKVEHKKSDDVIHTASEKCHTD